MPRNGGKPRPAPAVDFYGMTTKQVAALLAQAQKTLKADKDRQHRLDKETERAAELEDEARYQRMEQEEAEDDPEVGEHCEDDNNNDTHRPEATRKKKQGYWGNASEEEDGYARASGAAAAPKKQRQTGNSREGRIPQINMGSPVALTSKLPA
ncbi:hypothetical protein FA95DRAFT_1612698 [Auriscalpium vulgare]|uniref:Uncharacterized protein n=1 Tax=Auriscalpium vulgare TaxID=40419 RepID=A0ACB8R578_9AGAM|nr:hypothetical protein FA95DRAFT_1612698 [Auriscalpium vulgare]